MIVFFAEENFGVDKYPPLTIFYKNSELKRFILSYFYVYKLSQNATNLPKEFPGAKCPLHKNISLESAFQINPSRAPNGLRTPL